MKNVQQGEPKDRCYFCDKNGEYSLLVSPRPKKEHRATRFGSNHWFQSFCRTHWNQILKTGPLNLTRPVERKDLICQSRPRRTLGRT